MEPDKVVDHVSNVLRKFFAGFLDIKYQFTFDELSDELKKRSIDGEPRSDIETLFRNLDEMQYSGGRITQDDAEKVKSEAAEIIRKVSGYAEVKQPKGPYYAGGLLGLLSRLGKPGQKIGDMLGVKLGPAQMPGAAATDAVDRLSHEEQPVTAGKGSSMMDELESSIQLSKIPPMRRQAMDIIDLVTNLDTFDGKPVSLSGSIIFVNTIVEVGDFWYMFRDGTGSIVAFSKMTNKYAGKGTLKGIMRKTLSGEGFIEIENFDAA